MKYFGGIEAGGTKFNCIIAKDPTHIIEEKVIPTTSPEITLKEVARFFKDSEKKHDIQISAMGIASFGPVILDSSDPAFGYIASTPKLRWQNTPVVGMLRRHFDIPFGFDTDVNGAALGEGKWGAGRGLSDFIYITIGTGIGAGIISHGAPIHGLIHPEVGHMLVRHDPNRDPFAGYCPFHGDCLEGMASGPAMSERWGIDTKDMPDDHPAWNLEAEYLAQAVHNLSLFYSPKRIIMGGGVMKKTGLIEKIRQLAQSSLNGYLHSSLITQDIDQYLVTPQLGDRAGSLGAVVLATLATSS